MYWVGIIIAALLIGAAPANALYYNMLVSFDTKPIVCISKPKNDVFKSKHSMIKAVAEWKMKLPKELAYKIILPKTFEQIEECNVIIVFVEYVVFRGMPLTDGTTGIAECEKNVGCLIQVSYNSKFPENTLKHEFGHALGLGHPIPEVVPKDLVYVALSNDVMTWFSGKFRKITQDNIDALLDMYGTDGYVGPNKSMYNYTIDVDSKILAKEMTDYIIKDFYLGNNINK